MRFERCKAIAVVTAVTIYAGTVLAAASAWADVVWAGADRGNLASVAANKSATEDIGRAAHKYATFIVARLARISPARSHRLSFFSQLPDDEYCLNAITASDQVLRIRATVHSLHGGGAEAVTQRQRDLRSLLARGVNGRPLSDLQMGLVLHALSDSYAHTYTADGKAAAYGPVFGHARASLLAQLSSSHRDPDLIAHFPEKFKRYTCDLYKTFTSPRRSCTRRLRRLNAVVDGLSARRGDELARMRALALRYGFNDWHYRRLTLKYGITDTHFTNPVPGCASKIPRKKLFDVMRLMERKFAR